VTAFTSAFNRHGGSEATILSLGNVFYHWGALIVPPGYTDPVVHAAGGNPYGTSFVTGPTRDGPDAAALEAAQVPGTAAGPDHDPAAGRRLRHRCRRGRRERPRNQGRNNLPDRVRGHLARKKS